MRRSYGSGGLIVRTDSGGRETWYGKWRVDGQQVKRRIGPKRTPGRADGLTKADAEKELRKLMAAESGPKRRSSAYTVDEVWTAYAADRGRALKDSTLTDYGSYMRHHVSPFFAGRSIASLEREDIDDFVSVLVSKGLAPKSVRTIATFVFGLCNYAVRRRWITYSPATGVTLPTDETDETGALCFLEVFEVHDLAQAARPGVYQVVDRALFLTASLTGLRQGELRALRWSAVDLVAARVRVERNLVRGKETSPKSRERRSVPLAPVVVEALYALREVSHWIGQGDHVFADPATGKALARTPLMDRYREALVAAGLDRAFRFHDLRHTFGTTCARAGEPVTSIQRWMGHADLKTTERYMHYAPAIDEAARIGRAFAVADPRRYQPGTNMTAPHESESTSEHLTGP